MWSKIYNIWWENVEWRKEKAIQSFGVDMNDERDPYLFHIWNAITSLKGSRMHSNMFMNFCYIFFKYSCDYTS